MWSLIGQNMAKYVFNMSLKKKYAFMFSAF